MHSTLDLLILRALMTGSNHGLGIARRVEQIAQGAFRVQDDGLGASLDRQVVERFTRSSGDAIEYYATVTDPSIWTRPWTMVVPWRAANGPLFEYACHEGKYSMTNLLATSRAVEAER